MNLVIGTVNVQNKYKIKKYNGIDNNIDNVLLLKKIIEDNNADILGTQEMIEPYLKRLKKVLLNYKIVGRYRYTILGNYFKFTKKYNEANSIISKHKIIHTKTIWLPFKPDNKEQFSKLKNPLIYRILTKSLINIEGYGKIYILNTHLDYKYKSVQKKQLNKIYKIINKIKIPVILTGDFNMNIEKEHFNDFIKKLEKLNIKKIDNNTRTYKTHKKDLSIDHIFISNNFIVEEIKYIKDDIYNNFSDHYPVLASIKIK